jgi:phenylacetate 2-hydroxylase
MKTKTQNAYAADYDPNQFPNPEHFNPERFLHINEGSGGTPHYAYGAGSRMCAGSHLANRELYTAFIRLITAFEILPAKSAADQPILDCIACNAIPTSLTTEPKPFKVLFRPRDPGLLDRWIGESELRTRYL